MKRSHRSALKAGTEFERSVADYLAATLDDDRIDRRPKNGTKDRGDIGGVRVHGQRLVIECKNVVGSAQLSEWVREAHTEAGNDDALVGVVCHKRHGVSDPGKQWVSLTLDDFAALIDGQRHGHRREIVQ